MLLADIWPTPDEIRAVIGRSIDPDLFRQTYASVFDGDDRWRALPIPDGDRYAWADGSTYIAKPPFFDGLTMEPAPLADIDGARVLALLGDSRDHRPHQPRPARSPRDRPPASGCRHTAWRRSTSTPTGPAAVTTR